MRILREHQFYTGSRQTHILIVSIQDIKRERFAEMIGSFLANLPKKTSEPFRFASLREICRRDAVATNFEIYNSKFEI
jgi:hypothetical protein